MLGILKWLKCWITNVWVNVLIVVSDSEIPEDGGFIEVTQGDHILNTIGTQVLSGFDLKWEKKYTMIFRQSLIFSLVTKKLF